MEFLQTTPFHTFFLPKRERKYQRKRFRAAARTPRGHRSCSALPALEMQRRLQRCYCSSKNEALAPLIGRKTYVFGCSHEIPPKTPEGKRAWAHGFFIAISKSYSIKISAGVCKTFSYIFICEANKNIDQAKEVRRKPRQLRRLRWCLREILSKLLPNSA